VHNLPGLLFQAFEDDDFGFELLDGLRGRGLVDDGFFEVLVVVGRQRVGRFPNVLGRTIEAEMVSAKASARLAALRSFSSSTRRLSLMRRRLSDW
jgi:hypothetical protein